MADLIDRQAAKEAVKHIPWCDWEAVGDCLDEIPTVDAVPVVRCKDCKYCMPTYDGRAVICRAMTNCNYVNSGHFCSYGERKDNATD